MADEHRVAQDVYSQPGTSAMAAVDEILDALPAAGLSGGLSDISGFESGGNQRTFLIHEFAHTSESRTIYVPRL